MIIPCSSVEALASPKMFTKEDALADIHAPFFGPVFSYNLQFLNYFIENKALQAFYFSLIRVLLINVKILVN